MIKDGVEEPFGCDAANVSYNGGSVKDALDGIGQGSGSANVPLTNNDPVAYDLQRVFEKTFASEDIQPQASWQFQAPSNTIEADKWYSVAAGTQFKVVFEIKSSGGTLGQNGISFEWRSFFGLYRSQDFSALSHKYDGYKYIYTFTGQTREAWSNNYAANSGTNFKLNGIASGDTVRIAIYVECDGHLYLGREVKFSATADSSSASNLQYSLEWDNTATTVNKVRALVANHMVPMVSASPEYDPFVKRVTTPRVLVTIVSDDGGVNDYLMLHPMIKSKEAAWNAEHPEAPVHLRWSCAIPSNYPSWDENNRNTRSDGLGSAMTVRMVRELVADGVSILSHAYNHDMTSTWDNVVQLERIAVMSKIQLERMIGVPCIHYCLPGGGGNNQTTKSVLEKYFLSMATTSQGINTQDSDSFSIFRFFVVSGEAEGHITQAQEWVANNNKSAWVIFLTHSQEWNKHHVTLEGIVDYCLANGIPLVNYSEAYAEIYPPIERLKQLLGLS